MDALRYILFCIVILQVSLQSQTILDYKRTIFSGTYQTISGIPGPSGDDEASNYSLPFQFKYIDHVYNQVRICTNGWIELGSSSRPLSFSSSFSGEVLFSGYEPKKVIAPWWGDLGAFFYPVEYQTIGSSPNRVFVVQWKDVNAPYYSTRSINFQVRLYETSNTIEFCYGNVSGSGDPEYAVFGIKDHIGGTGHFIDGPTGSTTIGTYGLNSISNWPSVFYRFAYAPVSVTRPNGGEFFSIGYTDTIKWTTIFSDVKLEYSTNSGNSWDVIENSVPAASGKYAWMVPNTPSDNSLIRISDVSNNSVFDVSDNVFTISEPPVISISPDSLYFLIDEGDSTESSIQISNTGAGLLFYEISSEIVNAPGKKIGRTSVYNSPAQWRSQLWEEYKERDKYFKPVLQKPIPPDLVLPLIVSDPAGDGGTVDIIQIRGQATTDSVELALVFSTQLNLFDFGSIIGLDTDQNVFTGIPLPYGMPGQEVGCEYYLSIHQSSTNLMVEVYNQYNNFLGAFSCISDLYTIYFAIPLSVIGNDDGKINLAAIVGNYNGPTDWIPDAGYGTLGGNWLYFESLSGTIVPGNSENISVRIKTDMLDGGDFYANILISSNDPINSVKSIPVHLTVIGQPNLIVPGSINFNQVFVGYPLTLSVLLKNNGSLALEVSNIQSSNPLFTIQGSTAINIPPNGTYQLSIQFSPVTSGIENGTLTFISNDPSSPEILNVQGEGIHPPVISVSPDSFFYNLNVGDSLVTQMTIDNSAGLGELIYQITDRSVYTMNRKPEPALKKERYLKLNETPVLLKPDLSKAQKQVSDKQLKEVFDLYLPVIITDSVGDGGVADIKEIRARIDNNKMDVEYVFADGIVISDSTNAVLYLDTDRNPMTGIYEVGIGVDYYVFFIPLYLGNEIWVMHYTGMYYSIPYAINGSTIAYSIPLEYLGNDDGEMDVIALSSHFSFYEILDKAPDEGYATIHADAAWLTQSPGLGIIPPGGSATIDIHANTSELIGGNYLAVIDISSNDPVTPNIEIPFAMHLTGIPMISVTPGNLNFGKTYINYFKSIYLAITSTGTDSLIGNITSGDPQFVLMDSTFALPVGGVRNIEVRFYPYTTGNYNSQLTINSNCSSTPLIISMTGEGVIAPNITTSVQSFQFESTPGEIVETSFTIYNTGGDDLEVEISDIITSSTGERLFTVNFGTIYEINPNNGEIINSFPTPVITGEGLIGIAYSGSELFFIYYYSSYAIYVLNPDNGNIIRSFGSPGYDISGLAYIDNFLYASSPYGGLLYKLNPLYGNVINTISITITPWGGIDGLNGRLFASDGYFVFELNPSTGAIINQFAANNFVVGIGCTGLRLFTSNTWSGIDEYDPDTGSFKGNYPGNYFGIAGGGNSDASWITENPGQVTIAAGDSAVINIKIISPDSSGYYSANIKLSSNDPDSLITLLQVALDVVSSVGEENSIPSTYSLYYNYPNPFNPSTTIKYDLPEQGRVSLKIFNIVGEEVAVLVNEEQDAGRYKISWNAMNFASGVYFYKIQTANFVDVKKLVLIK